MASIQDVYGHVFTITGPLDAICSCEPPGANGRSDLPWYHSLLNLLGIVKVARAESAVFLGLKPGHLVYLALNDEGEALVNQAIPFAAISGATVKARDEWTTEVGFTVDGKRLNFAACGFVFGEQTPPELIATCKQLTGAIVQAIAARA